MPQILLVLFALLMPVAAAALAQARAAFIGVDEIRPGMRGYGLTVFRGTEPTRFDVEVIDVLHNFQPDQDLILIRADHPELQKANTVAGMSGSPVFLEGKLAGAYAYGWYFGKEPVAGVTPIANMMAEIERPLLPGIWRALGMPVARALPHGRSRPAAGAHLGGLPAFWGSERPGAFGALRQHAERLGLLERSEPAAGDRSPGRLEGPRPVATPVLMGGLESSVVEMLDRELGRFGLAVLQAGGGADARQGGSRPTAYQDGSALGVQLIRGDISATATGTVTHVEGNRLVAFGHPLMNAGQLALPTTVSRVLYVLASEQRSFKITEPVSPIGTLIHDRQAAVVVDTRMTPDAVPVKVRVSGVEGAPRREWNMEVAGHRILTPVLTFAAIRNALQATCSDRSNVVFTATSRVGIAGHGTVQVQDIGYAPLGVAGSEALSGLRLFDLIETGYGNPFEDTRITGVQIDLDARYERDVVTLVDAMVAGQEVDPGRPVNVQVVLRRFGKPEEVRVVPVEVPTSAAGEEIELALQPGNAVHIEQPKPENLDDLIETVKSGYPSTSLVISTKLPSRGLRMFGQVVNSLPGSAMEALQLLNESDSAVSFVAYDRISFDLGQVVVGSAQIKLKVRPAPREQ